MKQQEIDELIARYRAAYEAANKHPYLRSIEYRHGYFLLSAGPMRRAQLEGAIDRLNAFAARQADNEKLTRRFVFATVAMTVAYAVDGADSDEEAIGLVRGNLETEGSALNRTFLSKAPDKDHGAHMLESTYADIQGFAVDDEMAKQGDAPRTYDEKGRRNPYEG